MAGSTTVGSQMAKIAKDQKDALDAEDAAAKVAPVPPGKVTVRLIRAHYDRFGVFHEAGITMLDEGFVPESAIPLTASEAAAEE